MRLPSLLIRLSSLAPPAIQRTLRIFQRWSGDLLFSLPQGNKFASCDFCRAPDNRNIFSNGRKYLIHLLQKFLEQRINIDFHLERAVSLNGVFHPCIKMELFVLEGMEAAVLTVLRGGCEYPRSLLSS